MAAAIALLQASGAAFASGFALRENSAASIGSAFAGMGSLAEDLSTIFANPAGMTYLSGNQAQATGMLIFPSIRYDGTGTSVGGTVPTGGSGGGDAGVGAFVPALYGLLDVSPDLKFGLAITSPFGLMTEYKSDWVGRYLGIKSEIKSIDINPNAAYRVNDWLSIGAGVSAQNFSADLSNAVNSSAIASFGAAPPNTLLPDGRARFDGDSWGWGYNLGVLLEPVKGTRLGAAFRSRVEHDVKGDVEFSMPAALAALPNFQNSEAKSDLTLPENVLLSVTQVLTPQWTLAADLQWTNWSRITDLTVRRTTGAVVSTNPENYRDTMMIALGGIYKPSDSWTLRTGFAFEQTPIRDEYRTVRLPDEDRYMLALGFTYKISNSFQLDAAYLHYFLPSADISQSVNNTSVTGDVLNGSFRMHSDVLSLSARFRF
jgi:long-chain fatty acid transport protein